MNSTEVGYAVSSRDFLVLLDGLPTIRINDMVESENGARGWVNAVSEDMLSVLMVDETRVSPGQMFKILPKRLEISVGDFLLGRSINPLGVPIDGKGLLSKSKNDTLMELEKTASGIESRQFITKQLVSGITLVDLLLPIGKGQRELVIGDAHSGKTGFLLDIIVNQKNTGVVCIYASIGKPAVSVRNLIDILKANGALSYTVIVAASSSEPAPLIFLTPKTAFSVAEYFQRQGKDVILILDDMGTHAKIYREIALLANMPPGKESYPGDAFYQSARLLERAGNFLPQFGGGSITALPVIELDMSDFTSLIPTNLMSATDGHLLFRSSLRAQGQSPAIDISLSVTRVGKQTQSRLSNMLSTRIRQVLSQALDFQTISRFSTELSGETQLTLRRFELIMEFLKQDPLYNVPERIQLIFLALPFTHFLEDKSRAFVEMYKQKLTEAFNKHPSLSSITKALPKLNSDDDLIKLLNSAEDTLKKLCP